MQKIQSRDYTVKERGTLKPTELGTVIARMLEDNFKLIMDVTFTATMEDALEQVAENKIQWKELIAEFSKEFIPTVENAEKEAFVPKELTDLKCPKCEHKLQKIWSRNKYFYGCSNYPDCDYTAPIEALEFKKEDYAPDFDWDQHCPKCGNAMKLRFGRFGAFLGCSTYPKCKGIVNIPKLGEAPPAEMPPCVAVGCNGKLAARRSRFGKTFYSCSNYPDCDIIVNNLEDLHDKYVNHPKTAYVKKAGKAGGKKGGRFSSKMKLSDELKAVVGDEDLSRGDVTKKLWEYIKKHKLQDPKNKRRIVPDAKLAKIFGSKTPVDMMQLAGLINKHFV
jgi:DNA topoisomerase-1